VTPFDPWCCKVFISVPPVLKCEEAAASDARMERHCLFIDDHVSFVVPEPSLNLRIGLSPSSAIPVMQTGGESSIGLCSVAGCN
jgi:hypothetical protein